MRVNRREGYQTMEERCLKKAMSKPNMEKNNWRLEKGGARSVEIKMGESKSYGDSVRAERKKGERKKGKSVFKSGMKNC